MIKKFRKTQLTGGYKMSLADALVKETVTIGLERYEELVKKEAYYDALMVGKKLSIYMFEEVKEGLKADDKQLNANG